MKKTMSWQLGNWFAFSATALLFISGVESADSQQQALELAKETMADFIAEHGHKALVSCLTAISWSLACQYVDQLIAAKQDVLVSASKLSDTVISNQKRFAQQMISQAYQSKLGQTLPDSPEPDCGSITYTNECASKKSIFAGNQSPMVSVKGAGKPQQTYGGTNEEYNAAVCRSQGGKKGSCKESTTSQTEKEKYFKP